MSRGSVCFDRKWFGEASLGLLVLFQIEPSASDLPIVGILAFVATDATN